MPRCIGHKPDGSACQRIVPTAHSYCYSHDPERQAERTRNAAIGGRSKASAEVRALKAEIRTLIADVRAGSIDRNDASVMVGAYRALRDYIELERRVVETDELMTRLRDLEEAHASAATHGRNGAAAWG
jgi:hypothetical protein